MQTTIEYKYFFAAIGERHNNEWKIKAMYSVETVPAFDLEGDPTPADEFERIVILSANDHTLGFNSGDIELKDIPVEVRRDIVSTGIKIGSEKIKQYEVKR